MIALPRFTAPNFGPIPSPREATAAALRVLATNRLVGLGAAAALLLTAVGGVLMLLHPGDRDPMAVRVSLSGPLAHAPQGWRQTLAPLHGPVVPTMDVVRLSERPLAPMAGATWNKPGAEAARPLPASGALTPAPITGYFAPGPGGPLPIIAPDGQTPFDAYRRPFTSNGRPKVALVIGGLGLNARATQAAIETLPGEITLSFVPYAEGLQGWIDMARAHGHEVLLETPMEPVDYPDNDPGPYTLMTDAQGPETVKKLEWILSRTTGYFGLTNYLGSRFLGSDRAYEAFVSALRGRGLGFIDDGSAGRRVGGGLPRASAERVIDDQLSKPALDQQLLALEAGALQRGQALGSGFAYPVTLETVARWSQGLEQRGFQLAPASAVVRR
jgi:polysaccharide deacetylase 2 family uncharacterized protein YibQ